MMANEYIKEYGLDIAKKAVSECTHGYGIDLVELKRLVESHELVERHGGINGSRKELANLCDSLVDCAHLCQAIADVESCI